ncbi:MAG: Do family serine endopeptidase [Roseburia sp.]|nr:Do family serine endopeptidase [Roseburia sp.]
MNTYVKISLVACGVAIASSAMAILAMRGSNDSADNTLPADVHNSASHSDAFLRVSSHPAAENDFTKAAESSINGVVSIKSYATPKQYSGGNNPFADPFFEFFFGPQQRRQQQDNSRQQQQQQQPMGLGSGVIITSDGYIVTNNHVVDGADRLEITLNDNRSFDATIIGTDAASDLALVKIDATDLPVIPMGDSDALKVGEWVLAVGNPFGFTSTVTAGIVSAKARSISSATGAGNRMGIESFIQTDAAVNPGNSGGALVNLNGELVGINTAIYSQTGNYAGYSFAIPTSIVTKIMSDIKQYGTVQRAVLGVMFRELDKATAKEKGITAVNDGLYVAEVVDRSAAAAAGIQPGDVITAINGKPTHNQAQLMEEMNRHSPGDKITVTLIRDNKEQKVAVTLLNNQGGIGKVQAASMTSLGCAFKKLSDEQKKRLNVSQGVEVTGIRDGSFREAGVKDGFIILEINNQRVNSSDDVEKIYNAIMKSEGYDKVMFITGLYPTGKKMYYAVDLAE